MTQAKRRFQTSNPIQSDTKRLLLSAANPAVSSASYTVRFFKGRGNSVLKLNLIRSIEFDTEVARRNGPNRIASETTEVNFSQTERRDSLMRF